MKHLIAAVSTAVLLAASPAWAGVGYDASGRVYSEGTYEGPGIEPTDLILTGLAGLAFDEAAPMAVASASFVVWGAQRTARYRPQAVKDAIHEEIAARESAPVVGTAQEVLQ